MKKLILLISIILTGCTQFSQQFVSPTIEMTSTPIPTKTMTLTPTITPTPTITSTPTITPTPTSVKIEMNFEEINNNIDDFLSGKLDYKGPNNDYMWVGSQGNIVPIGFSYLGNMVFTFAKITSISTTAVLLGFFDNGIRQYLVLGTEKYNQRIVFLIGLGFMDNVTYPGLNLVQISYYGTDPKPQWSKITNTRHLVRPENLSRRISKLVGRPIRLSFDILYEDVDYSYCGQMNEIECVVYQDEIISKDFSIFANWLDGKGDISKVKLESFVITEIDSSYKNKPLVAPYSSNLNLPLKMYGDY